MTQPADTTCNSKILDLPATLDAETAKALIAQMSALPPADEVSLDAAAVQAISPGYLQVLVSAFKTFSRLSVINASAEFVDAFAAYGIAYPQASAASVEISPAVAPKADPAGEAPASAPEAMLEPEPVAMTPEAASAPEVMSEPEPVAAVTPEAAAKTVLTIDDSRTMRDMLNMALSGAGFTVVQAVDGQDGLTRLAQQPVDVIITDINMPKLDGYGVIRAVRSDPAYNNTPILVLSTEAEQESKDIAKDAGATGWIVKPFDPDGLVSIVNSVCG
jgi:two-component system chemotaxis response regulator CheY